MTPLFGVVIMPALAGVKVVGPFSHMEDAKRWAEANVNPAGKGVIHALSSHVAWHVIELISADSYKA